MTEGKPDLERLIVKRLDGALTDDEALVLDREMMRDPELRSTFEAYKRIDEWSTNALNHAVRRNERRLDLDAITTTRKTYRFRRPHRGWLLIPGAIAAALLATVVPWPEFSEEKAPNVVRLGDHAFPTLESMPTAPDANPMGLMRNVNQLRRNTGREVIGVIGEDGNIYWIEVDRTRTIRVPSRPPFATELAL